jgi:hypothetical protein
MLVASLVCTQSRFDSSVRSETNEKARVTEADIKKLPVDPSVVREQHSDK